MAESKIIAISTSGEGYCEMADGTLICYGEVNMTVNFTTNTGNGYLSSLLQMPDFTKVFNNTPVITYSAESSGYDDIVVSSAGGYYVSATSAGKVYLSRPYSTNNAPVTIRYIAIGRWR